MYENNKTVQNETLKMLSQPQYCAELNKVWGGGPTI